MKKLFLIIALIAIAMVGFSQNGDQSKNKDRNQLRVETCTNLTQMNQVRARAQKMIKKNMQMQKKQIHVLRTGAAVMRSKMQKSGKN